MPVMETEKTTVHEEGSSPLHAGDRAPLFVARTPERPGFQLAAAAGRCVVLSFLDGEPDTAGRGVADALAADRARFDDRRASLLLVTDGAAARPFPSRPGVHVILDGTRALATRYGLGARGARASFVLDPNLRVAAVVTFAPAETHAARVAAAMDALPTPGPRERAHMPAPVLYVPRVLEPELCRVLIAAFERAGGLESGYGSPDPQTGGLVTVVDHRFKRRRDHLIQDRALLDALTARFQRRLFPEIFRAFQFRVGAADQYLIARYGADEGGHFRAHRDNSTKETAHRRFAATINLNAEEYEGGDLRFPEYDPRLYRAETGGAIVFSCSLLHEVRPVTRGRRYCLLPFLYDEAGSAAPLPEVMTVP